LLRDGLRFRRGIGHDHHRIGPWPALARQGLLRFQGHIRAVKKFARRVDFTRFRST
jgi:hypothetical protein